MTKFAKLTSKQSNGPIYVNPAVVITVAPLQGNASRIAFIGNDKSFVEVKESAEVAVKALTDA